MKNCSKSKCLINVVAVTLFMFFYDMIVHGIVLKGEYEATASLWRPEAEMQELWPFCIVYYVVIAIFASGLFKMTCRAHVDTAYCTPEGLKSAEINPDAQKPCPIKRGVCFGTMIGMILAATNASAYMHIPVPGSLAISWFFASLIQGIGIGVLLSLINNKKGCTANG